jgi:hypothetical protein
MYVFLSPSDGQNGILIHGSYGNHKRSRIEVRLYYRSEKDGAFKSQVTKYTYLKLTPDNALVSPSPYAWTFYATSLSSIPIKEEAWTIVHTASTFCK